MAAKSPSFSQPAMPPSGSEIVGVYEPARYGAPGGRGQQNGPGYRQHRSGVPLVRTGQDPAEPLADT